MKLMTSNRDGSLSESAGVDFAHLAKALKQFFVYINDSWRCRHEMGGHCETRPLVVILQQCRAENAKSNQIHRVAVLCSTRCALTTDCVDDFSCGIPVFYLAFVCKTCSIDDDSSKAKPASHSLNSLLRYRRVRIWVCSALSVAHRRQRFY